MGKVDAKGGHSSRSDELTEMVHEALGRHPKSRTRGREGTAADGAQAHEELVEESRNQMFFALMSNQEEGEQKKWFSVPFFHSLHLARLTGAGVFSIVSRSQV